MALTSSTYADTFRENLTIMAPPVVGSFDAAAATSYSRGDFVTIGTDGTVTKASTDGQSVDGVVQVDVDNSSGAAADLKVPVVLKGVVEVDAIFDATSGAFDDPIAVGTQLGVAGDSGTNAAEAQALAVTPGGAGETEFTSLSTHAIPSSGTEVVRVMAFFQGSGKFV